ncbi:Uncharacterised protein [Mycobacterium tuberculosis]|nr:Uncharacterised protein [Mycobacterium tuberculosis]
MRDKSWSRKETVTRSPSPRKKFTIFVPVSPKSSSNEAVVPDTGWIPSGSCDASTITPSGSVDSSTVRVYVSFSGTYRRHLPSASVSVSASKPLPSIVITTPSTGSSPSVTTPAK